MADTTMTPRHHIIYEHDSNGLWFVRCPDIPGAHTHGRTIASARNNIREAIALVLDLPDDIIGDLNEEFKLGDATVQRALAQTRHLREKAADLDEQARVATVQAIAAATDAEESLSMRDLAELLGISHQRIQQISKRI